MLDAVLKFAHKMVYLLPQFSFGGGWRLVCFRRYLIQREVTVMVWPDLEINTPRLFRGAFAVSLLHFSFELFKLLPFLLLRLLFSHLFLSLFLISVN